MNEQRILQELLSLLESNGVTVRTEPLGSSGGGLCSVKKQWIFFRDSNASSLLVASLAAEALTKVIDIEQIYIRPEVRQFVAKHSGRA